MSWRALREPLRLLYVKKNLTNLDVVIQIICVCVIFKVFNLQFSV